VRAGRATALEVLLRRCDSAEVERTMSEGKGEGSSAATLPALPVATEVRGLYSAAMVLIEALLIPRQGGDADDAKTEASGAVCGIAGLGEEALAKSLALLAHRHACSFAVDA
jgi:hypothetical protein